MVSPGSTAGRQDGPIQHRPDVCQRPGCSCRQPGSRQVVSIRRPGGRRHGATPSGDGERQRFQHATDAGAIGGFLSPGRPARLSPAETMIGSMYKKGNGVEQDPVEALKWYTQAAEQGDSKALHWMAVSYLNGDGVAKDIGQAIQFYTKAADSGYALSQYNLGMIYVLGQGTERNDELAMQLFQKAAEQNLPSAQRQLGAMRETGL